MSKRYSRCRSAKLGALCPPMPVFKYAMLTPRRQKKRTGIKKKKTPLSVLIAQEEMGRKHAIVCTCLASVSFDSAAATLLLPSFRERAPLDMSAPAGQWWHTP